MKRKFNGQRTGLITWIGWRIFVWVDLESRFQQNPYKKGKHQFY